MTLSPEYLAAISENNEAIKAFKKVQELYRDRKIGDVDYLTARKIYYTSMSKFDEVAAKEIA